MNAEKYAEEVLKLVRNIAHKIGEPPKRIVIATYTRENYAELNRAPGDMDYNTHARLIRYVAERLAAEGVSEYVAFQDIEPSEYWRWLAENHLTDTRAARGAFAEVKYQREESKREN